MCSRGLWLAAGLIGCGAVDGGAGEDDGGASTTASSTEGMGSTSASEPEPTATSAPSEDDGSSGAEVETGETTGGSSDTGDVPPVAPCRAALIPEAPSGGAPRLGLEEIEAGAFYVSYSGLDQTGDGNPNETSNLFILKAEEQRVWVFGSGYGDPEGGISILRPGQDSVTDAATSVSDIQHVVESCFGYALDAVELHFVTPHFHIDHIHQELFDELRFAGVDAGQLTIHIHVDDHDSVFDYPWPDVVRDWDPAFVDRFDPLGTMGAACGQSVLDFDTVLGPWEVRTNPGHTPGTLNLRAADGEFEISGAPFFDCPVPDAETYFHIHRNLSWTDGPSAAPM